jgi:type II secretion system (T2SS) protein N
MDTAWMRALIGFALLAIAAAFCAPAALLDARIQQASQGRLRLSDASGWWWRGAGTLATADGTARMPLAWRVHVAELLRGAHVIDLHDPRTGAALGNAIERDGAIALHDVHIVIPAAALAALDPRLAAVTFGGALALDASMLTSNAGGVRADGLRGAWDRARIVVSDIVVDAGRVTIATTSVGASGGGTGTGTSTIENVGGELVVAGTLRESANGIDLALTLRPTATTPDNVRSLLPLLGTPDGTGGVNVMWHSRA